MKRVEGEEEEEYDMKREQENTLINYSTITIGS